MIDPERLAAFALMTSATSIVPGVSMLFVTGQAIRGGWRTGAAALLGMQLGYTVWWILAGLGLGTLAAAFPLAFRLLAIGGALYLAWLGLQTLRHAGADADDHSTKPAPLTRHAFRDGTFVALGNPKSLIYIVALLPPFVDPHASVPFQLLVFALVAMVADLIVGAVYIAAGSRLSAAMARPTTRRTIDRVLGVLYMLVALGILIDIAVRG